MALCLLMVRDLWASDYLFLSPRYLQLTQVLLKEADARAGDTFEAGSAAASKYAAAVGALRKQLSDLSQARLLKKLKPGMVAEVKDKEFADNLNTFKFALNAMTTKAGKASPSEIFPTYEEWIKTETAVVQMGVEERLRGFETRFGPDSEQINFIELFVGETLFKGDESGPSSWEPIVRLSAVQLTTSGPGLTSSFEAGMNYYFVKQEAPAPLRWIGVNNHVGIAASLQYLNDPRLMRFEGRPAFGLTFHLDRKEVGANWDPDRKMVRMTLGYAFQFVPFLL